jgi:MoaA/NifB/PqqE/SkfB family radical SAM enzyme
LGIDRQEPYTDRRSVPHGLRHHVSNHGCCWRAVAPVDRVTRELSQEEWQQILQKAWDAGIPHVIFTGGEPTLRPDLVNLILFAENWARLPAF